MFNYSGPYSNVYHLGHSKNPWTELNFVVTSMMICLVVVLIVLIKHPAPSPTQQKLSSRSRVCIYNLPPKLPSEILSCPLRVHLQLT